MSTYNSYPNFNAWLDNAWGSGYCFQSSCGFLFATGLVFGINPPYYLDDFYASYPKFFGAPSNYSGQTAVGSAQVTNMPSTVGLAPGVFIQSGSFPPGTVVKTVDSVSSVTMTQNATVTNVSPLAAITAFTQPPAPAFIMLQYVNLANASLVEKQWQEQWYVAMGWFIAHYVTLYVRSDALEILNAATATLHGEVPAGTRPGTVFTLSAVPTNGVLEALYKDGLFMIPNVDYTLVGVTITTIAAVNIGEPFWATWNVESDTAIPVVLTPAQVAAKGIAVGIETSKSVGDVSVSYQPLTALEDWGAWNLTSYGQLLATMAKVMGSGPLLIW